MSNSPADQRIARLRFRQLQMICVLFEKGSMRAASEALNVTATALSKSLRELEAVLGQRLFDRSTQGLVPTEKGELLVRTARAMIGEMHAVILEGNASSSALRALRVGSIAYPTWTLFPKVLAKLRADRIPVELVAHYGHTTPLAEQLVAGELDLLITLNTADSIAILDRELISVETLALDPLTVVVAHGVLEKPEKPQTWAQLARQPWILPPLRTHVRQAVDMAFLQAGQAPSAPAIEASQLYACLRLAAERLGLTAVPRSIVLECGFSDRLQQVSVRPELPSLSLMAAYRKSAAGARNLHLVIECLREHLDNT